MSKHQLYDEACRVAIEMGYASTSLFQRRFRISYGNAYQIIEQMEVNKFCEMMNPNSKMPGQRKLVKAKS